MITVKQNISMNQLSMVVTKRPENAKGYWQGISHAHLLTVFMETLKNKGWGTSSPPVIALSNDNADMAATFLISSRVFLGITTSNAMRQSLHLYIGTYPANGHIPIITDEMKLRRKHTFKLQLRDLISDIIPDIKAKYQNVSIIESKLSKVCSKNMADSIILHAAQKKIMPWSRIGKVRESFYKTKDATLVDLYIAFSSVARMSPSLKQMEIMNRFRKLLPY